MGVPNQYWKIDDGNSNFDLCDTYPPLIYVPASTSKAMLLGSSKFRSRGRLPVLSYLHPNGVRTNKQATIVRMNCVSRHRSHVVLNHYPALVLVVKKMNNFFNVY